MPIPAIEFEQVHRAFGDQRVLQGVNLRVETGTTVALLGASGSGKTVLLKHAAGLLHADRGHVRIDGEDLAQLSVPELQRVRRKLGILFQADALFDSLSVFDNVAFPLRERTDLKAAGVRRRVSEVLHLLKLDGLEAEPPSVLSGGMRKRVALARAIVLNPRILLDDNPTAGLDPLLTRSVVEALIDLRQKLGVTSLLITHDPTVAFAVADRIAYLDEGRIVEEGSPEAFQASRHPAVLAFLHSWLERPHAEGAPPP